MYRHYFPYILQINRILQENYFLQVQEWNTLPSGQTNEDEENKALNQEDLSEA